MSTDSAVESSDSSYTEPVPVSGQGDLDDLVGDADVVLADFHADWCGPCKMIEPVVERIAAETDAAVAKIDVDTNQQLAATYGVRGVPTLVLFSDGEPVDQVTGAVPEDQLRNAVERYT